MRKVEQYEAALLSALSEPVAFRARSALKSLIASMKQVLAREEVSVDLIRLCSVSYGHLASMVDTPSDRSRCRALALRYCIDGLEIYPESATLAATLANAAVDWFYDTFAPSDQFRLRATLARSRIQCQRILKVETRSDLKIHLLVQCASIFRCQAQIHGADGERIAEKARRTSEAALKIDPLSPLANLDMGLSLWSTARWAQSEEDFFVRLQDAESFLTKSHSMGLSLATLCLARLFRQTYRPIQALNWFWEYTRREQRYRIVLAEAHLVGESAVLLLHRNVGEEFLRDCLQKSGRLLGSAIQAGYRNARLFVSLARIRFAQGDSAGGLGFLQEIAREKFTDWTLAIERARESIEANNIDLLLKAFALGMNDGRVWNSLGTFAKEAMSNAGLAIRLYEVGLHLSPFSATLHTNLARLYIDSNDPSIIAKAKVHLDFASQHADFSFRWWKPLMENLQEKLNNNQDLLRPYSPSRTGDSLDKVYSEFLKLDAEYLDHGERGRILQKLVARSLRLASGVRNAAGSLNLDGIQSDATFKFGAFYYRVEVSWDARPNDRSEVEKLMARMDRAKGARGILLSMSGFTKGVHSEVKRKRATHIIYLIDGDEFKAILKGAVRLESLLEEKEARFYLGPSDHLVEANH